MPKDFAGGINITLEVGMSIPYKDSQVHSTLNRAALGVSAMLTVSGGLQF